MDDCEVIAVPGFPGYGVDRGGDVWSCRLRGGRGRRQAAWWRLKWSLNADGYRMYGLYVDGKKKGMAGHVLVALTFLGPRPDGLDTCHRNGRPADNRSDNLMYGTKSENARQAVEHVPKCNLEVLRFHGELCVTITVLGETKNGE